MAVSPWAAYDDVFDAHYDVASYGVQIAAERKKPFSYPIV